MKSIYRCFCIIFFVIHNFTSLAQTSQTAYHPTNPNASVSLNWLNDIPRIRYGGTGAGSSYGLEIQGPGDISKFVIRNSGNVGVGTSNPGMWFSGKVFEVNDARPILTLKSTGSLGTLTFTNNAVNTSTHDGEFHINHQYVSSNASDSKLRFASYPGGDILTIQSSGSVGVGTTEPDVNSRLEVVSSVKINHPSSRGSSFLRLDRGSEGRDQALIQFGENNSYGWNVGLIYSGGSTTPNFYISQQDQLKDSGGNLVHIPELTIKTDGNIGIGSSNPTSKLTVKGDIHAEEVRVDLSVPGPDYVFEEDYDLPSLESIQYYIKENKHLPEVPSAKEMEENGIDLGVMNMLLLKKVEELTLHLIEQNSEINGLKQVVANQQYEIENLKNKNL